jgi:hypothetical protein
MFRLRRTIGWLFLVVVAIFLVSLLGANLYVQSQATQERIQQELSQRLKMAAANSAHQRHAMGRTKT